MSTPPFLSEMKLPPARPQSPLWSLGFRPFFLFGSMFSAISILIWLIFQLGWLRSTGVFSPTLWHSHEMVFGFVSAIIAGFALTVVQNWTGKPGVSGTKLKWIVFLWLAARVLLFILQRDTWLSAGVDLSFYPLLAFYLFPYLKDPDLKIERVFFAYFLLFWIGNWITHIEGLGIVPGIGRKGVYLSIYTALLMIIFIGGRVIPFFTESSVSKKQPKTIKTIEVLSHGSAWAFLITQFFYPFYKISVFVAFFAGLVHLARLYQWQVPRVRRVPLIWVLHVAYLWIAVGFILTGFTSLQMVSPFVSIHAFAVGGIGVVIYGMITRVSLGHTGRRLHPSYSTAVAYWMILLSAALRVIVPLIEPRLHDLAVRTSAVFWIAAFVIFVWNYYPILTKKRI
jgi:uncharacterized protein involved in response to NO